MVRFPTSFKGYWFLLGLVFLCTLIEFVLFLADRNLVDIPRLRMLVYEYAGFWPGLLTDWHPNYKA